MLERGRSRGSRGRGRGRDSNHGDTRGLHGWRAKSQMSVGVKDFDNTGELNVHLSERFRGRPNQFDDDRYGGSVPLNGQTTLNIDVANYIKDQDAISVSADPGSWLALPEMPRDSEIMLQESETVILPRNRIDEPWGRKEKYLRTHYRLLREDAVTPLREAVARFRRDPLRMDDNETRIYELVRVVGLTFTYKGIASRIRFSTARANRKILWSASKRLTSGTLVALAPTTDNFQTKCILAIVAARPLENLEVDVPEIDIFFADPTQQEVDPQNTYVMIEATQGYYEAYRHTLKALQKQSQETFPLAEHICQLGREVEPPEYLKLNPIRNMTPAADGQTKEAFRSVNIIDNWPDKPSSALDPTQWAAMKDMLTKKVAIVQGPPGTGKTYVSKIALEVLICNRLENDPPIIVACQTNHALDQLLMFIRDFVPDFIRLGGRSNNPLVKKRALYEVRKEQVLEDLPGSVYGKARREINTQTLKIKSYLIPVRADTSGPMTAETLFNLGILKASQLQSLQKGAEAWVNSDDSVTEPLQMWLGTLVAPFIPVYSNNNFGIEDMEEDLEIEQQKERDAEMGVADEEDAELLKGDFFPLNMGQTMPQPTSHVIEQAKRAIDKYDDLYKVPTSLKAAVYMIMQERALQIVRARLRNCTKDYIRACSQIQVGRWEKDVAYLSQAPIIGMTTTGLSKYRPLIAALKPKIILIEEAAEVLEAPVGVSCVPSVEHLILVGDHQQLQAHCSVRELEGEPYHLNISMFERLVRNQLPHSTLLRQRRMEPAFRELIQPFYPELRDHTSVVTRDRTTWGMGTVNSWFFNHDWQELQDESMSTFNQHEADLIAKFYRHLIRNSVPAAAITVLTFYNGQRKKILRALKNDTEIASIYNNVKTVDSYQGEENDIVILSLVRNNNSGKIGFLDINNRIVVALSRAKHGFYIFGNGQFLSEHNEVWSFVEEKMYKQGRSSDKLPLICEKHGNKVWVKHPEDFDRLTGGGCMEPCRETFACGHQCTMRCHSKPHEWLICHARCERVLVCGHECLLSCHEQCSCQCSDYSPLKDESCRISNISNPVATHASEDIRSAELGISKLFVQPKPAQPAKSLPSGGVTSPSLPTRPPRQAWQPDEGSRIRFEQNWQPNPQPMQQPLPSYSHTTIQGNGKGKQDGTRNISGGKWLTDQPPAPNPSGDGGFAEGLGTQQAKEKPPQDTSHSPWDAETLAPLVNMSEWIDPEELKWQEEDAKQRGDDFW